MRRPLRMRELTAEEERIIRQLAHSRTASARLVERAQIIDRAHKGETIPHMMQQLQLSEPTVRKWWKRFEARGLSGLEDVGRPGAPRRYTSDERAVVIETALKRPSDLGCPFHCWTFERLAIYVQEQMGVQMKKTRIFEILQEEGLKWRRQESWFGERLDPEFAKKRGPSKL
ncbi:MAG: helix-turn-helix domain-containing protein [Ktedonobacteraceae bacterium]|nr:helix-turn-helix domain-containing protein [Ktedonobacteraceae bacterium]